MQKRLNGLRCCLKWRRRETKAHCFRWGPHPATARGNGKYCVLYHTAVAINSPDVATFDVAVATILWPLVQELSGRVGELEAVLRHCTELAVADLSRRSAEYLEEVESCVRATETHILGMRKIVKRYTRLPADNQHTEMLKKLLNKVRCVHVFYLHISCYNLKINFFLRYNVPKLVIALYSKSNFTSVSYTEAVVASRV